MGCPVGATEWLHSQRIVYPLTEGLFQFIMGKYRPGRAAVCMRHTCPVKTCLAEFGGHTAVVGPLPFGRDSTNWQLFNADGELVGFVQVPVGQRVIAATEMSSS